MSRMPGVNYKLLMLVPLILFILGAGILVNNYYQSGEWFKRNIELRGGTLITVNTDEAVDIAALEKSLQNQFSGASVRGLGGLSRGGVLVEVSPEADANEVLSLISSHGIDTAKSSIEKIGPALGESFWSQAQIAIIAAFIAMGIIVFIIFRSFVPSMAVIMAALSDILVTLAFMQVLGIELSLASFAAILMLIGYSVDTDILLTTSMLKGSGSPGERVGKPLKTGLTMTITTIGVLSAVLVSAISPVLSQIAAVLVIGLAVDIVNTWLQNAGILRWYMERRGFG